MVVDSAECRDTLIPSRRLATRTNEHGRRLGAVRAANSLGPQTSTSSTMGQSKETTWVCRQDPSSLQSSIDTKQEDSTNTRDSANPHRVALQAQGQAEQPTSRLIGYQRRDGSKLTLEQEWAAIRKEYNVSAGTRVFTMDGNFPGVRDALLDRGWVEHHEPDSRCFDLKWTIKTGAIDFSQLQPQQIVNHFKKNRAVTTKVGLARSLRELKWFEEIDSDSFFPRSYDLDDMEEVQTFTEDFMLVAAQNELRAFLEADAQDAKHRLQTAQLALIACEDFVRHWQADYNESDEDDPGKSDEDSETAGEVHNEKTGRETSRLSAEEWSLLLGEDCPIAAIRFVVGGDTAETCRQAVTSQSSPLASFLCGLRQCGVLPCVPRKRAESAGPSRDGGVALEGEGFRAKATSVLAQIQQMLGPQAGINGRDNLWIVKPASKSRGRGIQVVQRLGQVLALVTDSRGSKALCNERWVVQKYVENPLLIDGRKFDVRQWVLVSDWNPLTVWLYEQCYLRFALETYGTDDLANRRAHLCNNCVQRDAPDFEAQRAESMWPLERFRAWLLESYGSDAWEHVVLPQVRNIASWAVMCAQDVLENRKDSCELYGYDLVLDDQLKVWLLEVNSSPDMGPTTHVTEKLCYACLYDTVRVMVDYKSAAAVPSRLGQTKSKRTEDVGPEHEESESSKLTQRLPGLVSKYHHCTSSAPESGRDYEGSAVGSDTHFDLDLDPLLSSRGDGDALGTAVYAAWQRGVGGADGKEIGLKEKNCNTGGWCLIHRGEVKTCAA